jgi:hypothetical protein
LCGHPNSADASLPDLMRVKRDFHDKNMPIAPATTIG